MVKIPGSNLLVQHVQYSPVHDAFAMRSAWAHSLLSLHIPGQVDVALHTSLAGLQHLQLKPVHPLSTTDSPGKQVWRQTPLSAVQLAIAVQSEICENGKFVLMTNVFLRKWNWKLHVLQHDLNNGTVNARQGSPYAYHKEKAQSVMLYMISIVGSA